MKLLLDKHAIGERIKQIRGATSLSEYAIRYEVARQTVYNWQDGVNVPELDTLAQMALDADVRLDWLLFGLPPIKRAPAYDGESIADTVRVIEQALQDNGDDLSPDTYGRAVVVALEDGNAATFAAEIPTRLRFAVRPRSGRR